MAEAAELAPVPDQHVQPIYVNAGEDEPVRIESLCMDCHNNGTTTMLLTKVPHFRDIMVCSFECPHCNARNNGVSFTGSFGERGVHYELTVPKGDVEVLSRQVVKSDSAVVTVPELSFEIPAATQQGSITTVEGLLSDAASNLRQGQDVRREHEPEGAAQIDAFLERLHACCDARQGFTLEVDDPAGNSYVESPAGNPQDDPLLTVRHFDRTREQNQAIGLSVPEDDSAAGPSAALDPAEISRHDPHHGAAPVGASALQQAMARAGGRHAESIMGKYAAPEEVMELPGSCFACGAGTQTKMFQTRIPYFKEVIIMSNACDACGYRNAEVKAGGGISEQGQVARLQVTELEDLQRDVIKADSATVEVPELELELSTGTLGGLVTTVEGLIDTIKAALEQTQSFHLGDSAQEDTRAKWQSFFRSLEDCMELRRRWTLVLRDPLANSFISPAPSMEEAEDDKRLSTEPYQRTAEEDEHFGIDHLQTHSVQNQDTGEAAQPAAAKLAAT